MRRNTTASDVSLPCTEVSHITVEECSMSSIKFKREQKLSIVQHAMDLRIVAVAVCDPALSAAVRIAKLEVAVASILTNTVLHMDRFAVAGVLFYPKSPSPFGGSKAKPDTSPTTDPTSCPSSVTLSNSRIHLFVNPWTAKPWTMSLEPLTACSKCNGRAPRILWTNSRSRGSRRRATVRGVGPSTCHRSCHTAKKKGFPLRRLDWSIFRCRSRFLAIRFLSGRNNLRGRRRLKTHQHSWIFLHRGRIPSFVI
ncbi:hypothetical protein BC830DRAFT_1159882 [Chytriomyces sp. MP71]|nr:hypothetical protein BC830DRAFT_1159882 [Chytriomyces sp. MP71]